jgi:hypothetical protein
MRSTTAVVSIDRIHRDPDDLPEAQNRVAAGPAARGEIDGEAAVDHDGKKERIGAGEHGRLGRREQAEAHAADDDGRRQEGQEAADERPAEALATEVRIASDLVAMGIDDDCSGEKDGHDQARHDSAGEKRIDRGVGDDPIDHERQRRRNDRPDRRGRGGEADREARVVAVIAHRPDLDGAEPARIRHGRSRLA